MLPADGRPDPLPDRRAHPEGRDPGVAGTGVDVLTTSDAGLLGASDEQQLAHAHREGRVLVTQDQDFLRLGTSSLAHSGIAYARVGSSIGEIQYWLLILRDVMTPEEMDNRIEYL